MNQNEEKNINAEQDIEDKKENKKAGAFWQKASDFGKKAADELQKNAKAVVDKTKEDRYAQRIKKYNPLFAEEYKSQTYVIPEIIQIIDDDELQQIDVCEGAIGWRENVGGVEILHLSDAWLGESGLSFIPNGKCNDIYCVDAFDKENYIVAESVFKRAHDERLAELERIAFMLGAKMCSVEIIEADKSLEGSKGGIKIGKSKIDSKSESSGFNMRSGRTVTSFQGSDEPRMPTLKWFSLDESIKNLIDMRMSSKNSVKSRSLVLEGSTSATMSRAVACTLDILKKTPIGGSMERKAIEEHSSKLIFEIEF